MKESILIVGFGSIGRRHFENIISKNKFNLIICTKRKDIKFEDYNVKVVNNVNDAIKLKPKLAFITNETSFHIDVATKLAMNGIHLFIEKPLSNSTKNLKKLKKIVNQKNLLVHIGCDHRFHPCIKKIKKIIDEKKLGKIITFNVESSSFLPDWHPYEDYRNGYAAREELGGGITLTMIHELDFLRWFFGDVEKGFGLVGKFSNLEINTDDTSLITLQFFNKISGQLNLDFFQRPEFKSCKIKGENGTIYWDSSINEVKIYNKNKKLWEHKFKPKRFERNMMFIDELNYFLNCIKNDSQSFNNLDEAIKTIQVVLTVKKSNCFKKINYSL